MKIHADFMLWGQIEFNLRHVFAGVIIPVEIILTNIYCSIK